MKLTITEKKENALLNRIEVKAHAVFDNATPSNAEIAEKINAEVKGEVVVKNIYTLCVIIVYLI